MKEVFEDAGLSVHGFEIFRSIPRLNLCCWVSPYPCVLKPLSLSASQGVVRTNNREEFLAAAARVRRLLKSQRFLPHARRISIACSWKVTYREGK